MSTSLWYYLLGDVECGPVATDELRFLQKSGAIRLTTQIREEGSNRWLPLSDSGLIQIGSKRPARTNKSSGPAAQFQQATVRKPASEATLQTEPVSAAKPQIPTLPTALDRRRDQTPMAIAGVVLGLFVLLLLAWFLWPDPSTAPGMADNGSGEGAADAGANQSASEESSDDTKSEATSAAAESPADADSTGQSEAADPSASVASIDGNDSSEAVATSSGAGASDSVENAGAGMSENDKKSGVEIDAPQVADAALAVGEDDGSRFSISAPGETTFFGIRGGGRRFSYVVDMSGSMQGEPLKRAKEELILSISKLPSHVEFQIVFFDDLAVRFPDDRGDGFIGASKDEKKKATDFINGINGGGGTNVKLGMQQALTLKRKPDTVFLLTDGAFEFDTPAYIKSQNPGKKVRVNTVAFVNRTGEALLRKIADENRGDFRFVP